MLDAFTEQSGVTVNSLFVRGGLAERVEAEGTRSPADVLMTVDLGNLLDLVERGLTQPVESATLESAIPSNLRGPNSEWFTLSMRARILYAARGPQSPRPSPTSNSTILSGATGSAAAPDSTRTTRRSSRPTSPITARAQTESWLRGLTSNLGRTAAGGDRDVARDIMGGICEIGIGNSYYVGLMRSGAGGPEQEQWGAAIKVILPTFEGGGTHVNISGASVARNAPNRAAAVRFLEYLVSDEAQELYAEANFEYPVKAGATVHPIIAALGPLNIDSLPLTEIVRHRNTASRLVDQVGFDD